MSEKKVPKNSLMISSIAHRFQNYVPAVCFLDGNLLGHFDRTAIGIKPVPITGLGYFPKHRDYRCLWSWRDNVHATQPSPLVRYDSKVEIA